METTVWLQIIIIGLFSRVICNIENCVNETDKYEYHLATKTPYRIIANMDAKKVVFNGCEPQKLWMLVRHGTRNPSATLIEKMKTRLIEIRDLIIENNPEPTEQLRNSDLYGLSKWNIKLKVTDQKKLTHEGENEMLELAERMQSRFPSLLPPMYSNTSYFFKYTASQRTKASAKYFAAGLFGRHTVKDVWYPEPLKQDPVLRFYKLCAKWKSHVKNNPDTLQERQQLENSPEMQHAIDSVNIALNLANEKLSLEDIHLIYMTCAFETSWNGKRKSAWCSTLTMESIKAMEFAEDLKYYYRDGYGYELTYRQACQGFLDMIRNFESHSQYPKATVYFTHSGTLLKMLAHVGLYKETKPLTYRDYNDNKNHKWRVSKIDAFGTNLAFVLLRCDDQQKIAVFHQERLVKLPNCQELCDIETIKQLYSDSIYNCAFHEMCSIDSTTKSS